jgi:hypothetical protein
MKVCSRCKVEKEAKFFNYDKHHNRIRSVCKECSNERNKEWINNNKEKYYEKKKENYHKNKDKIRWYSVKSKYGITREDYEQMLKNQNGKCAICDTEEAKHWETNNLLIDHCHKSGKVRGLLCNNCNTALGLVDDKIEVLKRMIKYLK